MKKCLYSLLFFLSVLCGLCFAQDSYASSEGVFWSGSFSATRWVGSSSSSVSGNFTPGYAHDYSGFISFTNDWSNFSDLCFNFPSLVIDSDEVDYTLSVNFSPQNGRVFALNSTSSYDGDARNMVLSSSFGDSLNSMVLVPNSGSQSVYLSEYTSRLVVSGKLRKSSGSTSKVCFGGMFAQGLRTMTGDGVTISQPFISVYHSAESQINSSVNDVNDTLKDQQQKEEDAANQNQDDLKSDSDSSQNNVDDATQSLMSVVTDFVSAITSASPSNCTIDMNFGFFDAGSVNLCTGKSGFSGIVSIVGSIMMIGFTVPLCWCAVSKIVGLFRSFQG